MVYYQANRDSPVFPDLRGLLLKTAGMADVLAQALKPLAAKMVKESERTVVPDMSTPIKARGVA